MRLFDWLRDSRKNETRAAEQDFTEHVGQVLGFVAPEPEQSVFRSLDEGRDS